MFRNPVFLSIKGGKITGAQKVGKIKQDNVRRSTLNCVQCQTSVKYNSPYILPWVSPALEHSFWQVCLKELKENRQLVQKDTIFLSFLSLTASFLTYRLPRYFLGPQVDLSSSPKPVSLEVTPFPCKWNLPPSQYQKISLIMMIDLREISSNHPITTFLHDSPDYNPDQYHLPK